MTVDDMRRPSELLNRLQRALAEKHSAVGIIFKIRSVFTAENLLTLEVIFVIHEIHLQAGIRQGRHLDDEGIIVFINNNVDAGEAHHLMKPVTALIDSTETRHDDANLHPGIKSLNG